MKNEIFLSGSLSATAFSLIAAILLFTVFAVVGGIMVRRSGWKLLPALVAFLLIAILRGLLPLELTRAKIIHYPESVSQAYYALREPRLLGFSVVDLVMLVWLAGAVISFMIFLWKMIRQHAEVKRLSENASDALKDVFRRVCDEAEVRKQGLLFVGQTISSPMMVGFFRPVVLLPKRCEEISDEELRLILRHELAHFRKLDLWKKLVLCIVCCVFWWNPAAYFLRRAATQTQELRADAFACNGADEETRLKYAKNLLDTLKARKGEEKLVAAGYFNRSSDRYLKQRFNEILQFKQAKRSAALAWVAVALALVLCFGSYMANFQPHSAPKNAEDYLEEWENYDLNEAFILKIGDGVYQLYSDEQWLATLSEEDISSGRYDAVTIYDASVNEDKGDTK